MNKKVKKKQNNLIPEPEIYGTAVVGTKGQIVIPNEARKKYDIKPQDKLVVFGAEGGVLAVVKAEKIQELLSGLDGVFGGKK